MPFLPAPRRATQHLLPRECERDHYSSVGAGRSATNVWPAPHHAARRVPPYTPTRHNRAMLDRGGTASNTIVFSTVADMFHGRLVTVYPTLRSRIFTLTFTTRFDCRHNKHTLCFFAIIIKFASDPLYSEFPLNPQI